ncbi:hypothetical protein Mapa_010852 [Marchantia paleacea]|nr:hypothetical protein Mapa_010852 [Marchantia paleacea]
MFTRAKSLGRLLATHASQHKAIPCLGSGVELWTLEDAGGEMSALLIRGVG